MQHTTYNTQQTPTDTMQQTPRSRQTTCATHHAHRVPQRLFVAACACCRVGLGKLTLTPQAGGSILFVLVAALLRRFEMRCSCVLSVEAWRVLFAYLCLRVPEGLACVLHICTAQL
jgi:hypothetical protein